MKAYIKTYLDFFGYGEEDVILCEICKSQAKQIHHIHLKKMGGQKTYEYKGKTYDIDNIRNLIALCVPDHQKAHRYEHDKDFLMFAHAQKMSGLPYHIKLNNCPLKLI